MWTVPGCHLKVTVNTQELFHGCSDAELSTVEGPSLLQCCPPELCSRHTAGRPRRYLQYDPHAIVVETLQFLLEQFAHTTQQ